MGFSNWTHRWRDSLRKKSSMRKVNWLLTVRTKQHRLISSDCVQFIYHRTIHTQTSKGIHHAPIYVNRLSAVCKKITHLSSLSIVAPTTFTWESSQILQRSTINSSAQSKTKIKPSIRLASLVPISVINQTWLDLIAFYQAEHCHFKVKEHSPVLF